MDLLEKMQKEWAMRVSKFIDDEMLKILCPLYKIDILQLDTQKREYILRYKSNWKKIWSFIYDLNDFIPKLPD
jgi:hypothetical protein